MASSSRWWKSSQAKTPKEKGKEQEHPAFSYVQVESSLDQAMSLDAAGWRKQQLAEDAAPHAMGVPVVVATGQPAQTEIAVNPCYQPEKTKSQKSSKIPLIAPPVDPAHVGTPLKEAGGDGTWVTFDASSSADDDTDKKPEARPCDPCCSGASTSGFTPALTEGCPSEELGSSSNAVPFVTEDQEYWWTYAGQQEAISVARGEELDKGEDWIVKRKSSLKRSLSWMRKKSEKTAVVQCVAPTMTVYEDVAEEKAPEVSRKAQGIWKK